MKPNSKLKSYNWFVWICTFFKPMFFFIQSYLPTFLYLYLTNTFLHNNYFNDWSISLFSIFDPLGGGFQNFNIGGFSNVLFSKGFTRSKIRPQVKIGAVAALLNLLDCNCFKVEKVQPNKPRKPDCVDYLSKTDWTIFNVSTQGLNVQNREWSSRPHQWNQFKRLRMTDELFIENRLKII